MSAALNSLSFIPLLSSTAIIESGGNQSRMRLETTDFQLDFEGKSAEILKRILPLLDGTETIEKIASLTGFETEEVSKHIEVLAGEELIIDVSRSYSSDETADFIHNFLDECRFRSAAIFAQPFWQKLLSGKAESNLVMGWGIEFYHYVEAANEHMATSVAECSENAEIQLELAKHYVEEFDHSKIFLKGLAGCGLDEEQIRAAPPLASTRALINFLTESARSDTLAYSATFGVMQFAQEKTTREGISQFCRHLSTHYPKAEPFVEAIKTHALIDVDLNHQELLMEKILSSRQSLDQAAKRKVLRAMQETIEHFIFFFEGIYDYYGRGDILVPRQVMDFRTLE